jgi:hypothetical protein
MGILTKILEINNNKTEKKHDDFGVIHLYPENTERTIKKLTIKGYKTIKQYCTINKGFSIYTTYHNIWHNKN